MKLSIIIPVYQVEQYISDCFNSIFDTTSRDFEIVVVNDGSKDKSMDIVRSFTSNHKNIRLIEQKNQGLSSARMNGLGVATGDYVWFVDSDDYLLPGAIDKVMDLLYATPDIEVIAFPLLWCYDDGNKNRTDYVLSESGIYYGKDLLKNKSIPVWAAPRFVIRKSLFESEDLFFPRGLTHEDEYFGRVLLYLAERVLVMNKPVYVYRQREGSIMNKAGINSAKNLVNIYKLLSSFERNISTEDSNWFKKDIVSLLLESYTRNRHLFGTESFDSFRQEYSYFILSTFRDNEHLFSFKDKILGNLMLRLPLFFSRLMQICGK